MFLLIWKHLVQTTKYDTLKLKCTLAKFLITMCELKNNWLHYRVNIFFNIESISQVRKCRVFKYLNKNSNLYHNSLLWSMQSASLQSKRIEWQQIKFQTITHHFYCHRTTKFKELCTIKVAWGSNEKLKKVFFVNHWTIPIFFTFSFHKEWR